MTPDPDAQRDDGQRDDGQRDDVQRDNDQHDEERDEERVEGRSELLPEEQEAGSDDPHAQAEAILEESDERTNGPE